MQVVARAAARRSPLTRRCLYRAWTNLQQKREHRRRFFTRAEMQPSEAPAATTAATEGLSSSVGYFGAHHVAVICENLERAMEFYQVCTLSWPHPKHHVLTQYY